MPTSRTATNPAGVQINFDEDSHRYWTELVDRFVSGTSFVGRFFEPFDPSIARFCVDKYNRDQPARPYGFPDQVWTTELIQSFWRWKGKQACENGTCIHEALESILRASDVDISKLPPQGRWQAIWNHGAIKAHELKAKYKLIGTEVIVFSERFKLAGTIDILFGDGDTVIIGDWKSNEEISREGYKGKKARPNSPMHNLQACNFEKYALQLSFYETIMKLESYIKWSTPVKRILYHIAENGVEEVELPDYSGLIAQAILQEYSTGGPDLPI